MYNEVEKIATFSYEGNNPDFAAYVPGNKTVYAVFKQTATFDMFSLLNAEKTVSKGETYNSCKHFHSVKKFKSWAENLGIKITWNIKIKE